MGMHGWQRLRLISAVILVVSIIGMIWAAAHLWTALGLAVLAGLGIAGIFLTIKQERRVWQAGQDQQAIELINLYRHDWMNDIQLLFGYISLKKYDKLDDCMDNIRNKAQQESLTAKLGNPSLAAFFISFRLYYKQLSLELEMEQDINLGALSLDKAQLSRLVSETVKLFDAFALPSSDEPNVLRIQIDLEEDTLLFNLIYRGGFNQKELQQGIAALAGSFSAEFARMEEEYKVNKAAITIKLPLHH
jgi:stage 0 sporulation protein B (sporulation initiation phosphotransferase)